MSPSQSPDYAQSQSPDHAQSQGQSLDQAVRLLDLY